jgi:hypothetical protein
MSATAAHLVDHVLPETPIRQWVFTLPFSLRLRCAFDHELLAFVRRIFTRVVFSYLARQARAKALPSGALGFRSGAVNIVQRAGGSLNLNPHFHAVFIDGVYTRATLLGPARFHELPAPEPADVDWTLARIHSRLRSLFERCIDTEQEFESRETNELLLHLASASVHGQAATGDGNGRALPGLFTPEPDPRPERDSPKPSCSLVLLRIGRRATRFNK